ncbi:CD99 antigen-like protein 2 isoform X4 [Eucyclogobius newberryi]|uniref:CD99 antigen-like protein 2 isoform X4 n=1 Tax=Eucyclogobius newberryi TaxID=166745 RepID=UPI003B5BB654
MSPRSVLSLCALVALLLPLQVISQEGFDLADALDGDDAKGKLTQKPAAPAAPEAPAGGAGGAGVSLEENSDATTTTTKAPPKVSPKAPVKPKLGGFSDDDLAGVGDDKTYKPDKGKGTEYYDHIDQYDDNTETTAEVGTIAGIISAVAMALVGAITSYVSYQKKKFCFSIQQSLNAEMVKSENPDAVVATEPQVQQTLLEPANAEPPAEENTV